MANLIKPVLCVVTSHPIKGDSGQATGFWLSELTHARAVLEDAGIPTALASVRGGQPPIDGFDLSDPVNARYWNDVNFRSALAHSLPLAEIDPSRYSAVFFAGGHGTMWDFADSPAVQRVIRDIYEAGVDVQVLALTAPGFHNLESDSVTLAQRTNDFVAMRVAARPDRFQGLAALPTSAPREAARELERGIRELGLKGAMLYGRTREKNLDHQDNWPTFEAAADLGIPLFIHPQIPQKAVRDAYYAGFGSRTPIGSD